MSEGADPPGRKAGGHQVDAPREWMPLARGKGQGRGTPEGWTEKGRRVLHAVGGSYYDKKK